MRHPKARDTVISTNTQGFMAASSGLESHPPSSMSRRLEVQLERLPGSLSYLSRRALPWKVTWSTPLAAYSPTVLTRNVGSLLIHASFLPPTGSKRIHMLLVSETLLRIK